MEPVRGPEIIVLVVSSGLNAWLMLYKAALGLSATSFNRGVAHAGVRDGSEPGPLA